MQLLMTVTVTVTATVSSQEEPAALPRPVPRPREAEPAPSSFHAAPRNGGGGQARPRRRLLLSHRRGPRHVSGNPPGSQRDFLHAQSSPDPENKVSKVRNLVTYCRSAAASRGRATNREERRLPGKAATASAPGPGAGLSLKPSGPGSPAGDSVPQGPRRLHRGRDSEQPPSRVAQPDPWATAAAATRHVGLRRALFGCGEGFSP